MPFKCQSNLFYNMLIHLCDITTNYSVQACSRTDKSNNCRVHSKFAPNLYSTAVGGYLRAVDAAAAMSMCLAAGGQTHTAMSTDQHLWAGQPRITHMEPVNKQVTKGKAGAWTLYYTDQPATAFTILRVSLQNV